MFLRFQVFAFEGQNMTFTVNVLLSSILYCDAGSAAIRTVCKRDKYSIIKQILIMGICPPAFFLGAAVALLQESYTLA